VYACTLAQRCPLPSLCSQAAFEADKAAAAAEAASEARSKKKKASASDKKSNAVVPAVKSIAKQRPTSDNSDQRSRPKPSSSKPAAAGKPQTAKRTVFAKPQVDGAAQDDTVTTPIVNTPKHKGKPAAGSAADTTTAPDSAPRKPARPVLDRYDTRKWFDAPLAGSQPLASSSNTAPAVNGSANGASTNGSLKRKAPEASANARVVGRCALLLHIYSCVMQVSPTDAFGAYCVTIRGASMCYVMLCERTNSVCCCPFAVRSYVNLTVIDCLYGFQRAQSLGTR